jgi:hypothetical protein
MTARFIDPPSSCDGAARGIRFEAKILIVIGTLD